MPSLRAAVETQRDAIRAAVERHHGRRVRLFGSGARGEDRPDSDVDLLVDFDSDSSLFDLIRLTRELEELLGRPVDVVSTGGLKERDKKIEAEAIDL
jgi:predicted nucleotidyltransferase